MENLIILAAMLTAFLILLLVCGAIVWAVLRFNIEVKHATDNSHVLISYSRAKVGDVLKPLNSKDEVVL